MTVGLRWTSPLQHIERHRCEPKPMAAKQWTALFFVGIMAFAGCLGATEPAPEQPDDTPTTYSLDVSWTLAPETVQLGETVTYLLSVNQLGEGEYQPDVSVINPSFARVELVEWTEQNNGYHCLLYTSPSPRDKRQSRMPSSA